MFARASILVFWPNLHKDIEQLRASCRSCTYVAPSNPAPPPCEPEIPSYPFSSICADFFTTDAGNYLCCMDRFSGWISIFRLQRDDSAHVMKVLREYFGRWGRPEILTTDGASVFTSEQMKDFLARWNVRHRVSSAYYPRANKRAVVGVKSAKRLILNNLGPAGSLDTDKFARALLLHRNYPDTVTVMSLAQIIFGFNLRDHLPGKIAKYQPRPEWAEQAERRETALAQGYARSGQKLSVGSKKLPPLACGDTVAIQDQSNPAKPGRWTKTGRVVEVLGHDSYLVKVDGSGRTTQRNRRLLKPITPYTSLIRDTFVPSPQPMITRAQSQQLQAPAPSTHGPPAPVLIPAQPTQPGLDLPAVPDQPPQPGSILPAVPWGPEL